MSGTLLNRRRELMQIVGEGLPSAYILLSPQTGTYFPLPSEVDNTCEIICDFLFENNRGLRSVYSNDRNAELGFNLQSKIYVNTAYWNVNIPYIETGVRYITRNYPNSNNEIEIDGSIIQDTKSIKRLSFNKSLPFAIGASYGMYTGYNSSFANGTIRIYNLSIYKPGVGNIFEIIPAQQNGEAGFLDTVSGIFKGAVSGTFQYFSK